MSIWISIIATPPHMIPGKSLRSRAYRNHNHRPMTPHHNPPANQPAQRTSHPSPCVMPGSASSSTSSSAPRNVKQNAMLKTSKLTVTVSLADGAVKFADASGQLILAETPGAHRMTRATVQGEQTYQVQQLWRATKEAVHDEEGAAEIEGLSELLTCELPAPEKAGA